MSEFGAHAPQRRRRYIVDPSVQYRLIGLAVATWLVNAAFVFGAIFYLDSTPALPDAPPALLLMAAALTTVCLIVSVGSALVLSHRIAGPAYRIQRSLHRVTAGDLDFKVVLRRNDCFEELSESFNEMIDAIGARTEREIDTLRTVEKELPEGSRERLALEALREERERQLWGEVGFDVADETPPAPTEPKLTAVVSS